MTNSHKALYAIRSEDKHLKEEKNEEYLKKVAGIFISWVEKYKVKNINANEFLNWLRDDNGYKHIRNYIEFCNVGNQLVKMGHLINTENMPSKNQYDEVLAEIEAIKKEYQDTFHSRLTQTKYNINRKFNTKTNELKEEKPRTFQTPGKKF